MKNIRLNDISTVVEKMMRCCCGDKAIRDSEGPDIADLTASLDEAMMSMERINGGIEGIIDKNGQITDYLSIRIHRPSRV